MYRFGTFYSVLFVIITLCIILLCLRPYVPILAFLQHKELLFIMVMFGVIAIVVGYFMFPAFRSFDNAKVVPPPEYRSPGSPRCF